MEEGLLEIQAHSQRMPALLASLKDVCAADVDVLVRLGKLRAVVVPAYEQLATALAGLQALSQDEGVPALAARLTRAVAKWRGLHDAQVEKDAGTWRCTRVRVPPVLELEPAASSSPGRVGVACGASLSCACGLTSPRRRSVCVRMPAAPLLVKQQQLQAETAALAQELQSSVAVFVRVRQHMKSKCVRAACAVATSGEQAYTPRYATTRTHAHTYSARRCRSQCHVHATHSWSLGVCRCPGSWHSAVGR